ncbi:ADAM 17-like protease [Diaphorina citri]|nr:ADAM 17-like protease [Diaphorina citri]
MVQRNFNYLDGIFLACCTFSILLTCIEGSIHENLKYFDTLHSSHISHTIVKRGVQESNHPFNKIKEVTFKTLGK